MRSDELRKLEGKVCFVCSGDFVTEKKKETDIEIYMGKNDIKKHLLFQNHQTHDCNYAGCANCYRAHLMKDGDSASGGTRRRSNR